MTATKRIPQRDSADAIRQREAFRASSMRAGIRTWLDHVPPGRLPREHYERLREDLNTHRQLYVVFSYGTPIAWALPLDDSPGVVPDVKYSTTTSKHQGYARRGLGLE